MATSLWNVILLHLQDVTWMSPMACFKNRNNVKECNTVTLTAQIVKHVMGHFVTKHMDYGYYLFLKSFCQ